MTYELRHEDGSAKREALKARLCGVGDDIDTQFCREYVRAMSNAEMRRHLRNKQRRAAYAARKAAKA